MTDTLVWDDAGARYYETGVSRGIFFPIDDSPGVPWNGLVSVNLDPQGGEPEAYWFDGVKYMDRVLTEDFQATIQAATTPNEFEKAEGISPLKDSYGGKMLFGRRYKFHMSWKTEIGNDIDPTAAYKIHIIYNCLVQPSSRSYQTISDNTTPDLRSFIITATPVCYRQAYFVFDSRDGDLSELEAQLNIGVLPKCWELAALTGQIPDGPPGGGPDPDENCPVFVEDFEGYLHGQTVSETTTVGQYNKSINGYINNGLDITELPAEGDFAANDSAASEVGTHPVLVDDDDASYVTSAQGDLGYTIGLPPLVGYVEGCAFELHIRMSISGDVSEDDPDNLDADAQVHISTDAEGDLTIGGFSDGADEGVGFSLTAVDGSIVDYVIPLSMDAWIDSSVDDVATALIAGAYLNVVGATNNNFSTTPEVRVYEASVVMINDTQTDKFLRGTNTYNGYITQKILDGVSPQIAAHTSSIDFLILESTPDLAPYLPINQNVLAWDDVLGDHPGRLTIECDDSGFLQANVWGLDETSFGGFDPRNSFSPDTNVWYHVDFYWGWTFAHIKVWALANPTEILLDETIDTSSITTDPTCDSDHTAGWVSDGS